jgi:hypothetical protein
MVSFLIIWFIVGFGITTIITKSDIFEPLRNYLDNGGESVKSNFWGILINCPMCVGFWIGIIQSFVLFPFTYNTFFMSENSDLGTFYEICFTLFCKISDGAIIGSVSWSIHSIINVLDKYYDVLDAKEVLLQIKAKKELDGEL